MIAFQKAEQLEDVKGRIHQILTHCVEVESPLSYFAALYSIVAQKIEAAIDNKIFDNNERLAQMDIRFVNYYIDAMNCAFSGQPAEPHWQLVIDASKNKQYLLIQHLLIAMNAHINYDLANAVRDTIEAEKTLGFKGDFMKVNAILFSLLDDVQLSVSHIFHPLNWYLKFGMAFDDKFISAIMGHMRNDAFSFTCILALADEKQKTIENQERQQQVVALSKKILTRGEQFHLKGLFLLTRSLERGSIQAKTDKLLK